MHVEQYSKPRENLKPLPQHVLAGKNDKNYTYTDTEGKKWLIRAQGVKDTFSPNQRFRKRSADEVVTFSERAQAEHLKAVPTYLADINGEQRLVSPFIDNVGNLREFLTAFVNEKNVERKDEQLREFACALRLSLLDLLKAHQAGLVYGDRVIDNILLTKTQEGSLDIVQIDYGTTAPDSIHDSTAKEREIVCLITDIFQFNVKVGMKDRALHTTVVEVLREIAQVPSFRQYNVSFIENELFGWDQKNLSSLGPKRQPQDFYRNSFRS